MISRDVLKNLLKEAVVTVTFTKKDGTERVMECTLLPDFLPAIEATDGESKRKICMSCLPVWDLEKGAWRSFQLDSVKNISVSVQNNLGAPIMVSQGEHSKQ